MERRRGGGWRDDACCKISSIIYNTWLVCAEPTIIAPNIVFVGTDSLIVQGHDYCEIVKNIQGEN